MFDISRRMWPLRAGVLAATVAATGALGAVGCGGPEPTDDVAVTEERRADETGDTAAVLVESADREIFREKIEFARANHLDTLAVGETMVRLGRTFVGTDYVPSTLDVPGPERLVINLRELDCVTYVENVLAISRLVQAGEPDFEAFQDQLRTIRYRSGEIDGYTSRLHYFSEWIEDNERKGLVRNVTRELGGVRDTEPIDFMSMHPDAYRQLSDSATLAEIRRIETELSERPRYYIPEDRIAEVAPRIRNGDIIAATSSVEGLDVAHTAIAIWLDGELHLMHAPLVGKSVEISEEPLAERIQRIDGQDGIMVARPL